MAKRNVKTTARPRLIVEGGSRPRERKATEQCWTRGKENRFLRSLGESCNVKLAAKAAGASTSALYVRRTKDARFRAAWDQAKAVGYAQLEMMMLERALHGVEKTIVPVRDDGAPRVMREYNDRLGLALLRMHRDAAKLADEGSDPAEVEEAVERIISRLSKLKDRGPIETKAAPSRLALINAGLRHAARARVSRP